MRQLESGSSALVPRRRVLRGIAAALAGFAAGGCAAGRPRIDFARLEAPPEEPAPQGRGSGAVRLAVAPIFSPKRTSTLYQDLAAYMAARLGRPVELIQGKTYFEINHLVRSGAVPVAMVCTYPYILGREEFGMELIAAPEIDGEAVYYSLLIVSADSPARSLGDLRGATFGFSDPMSNSGRLAPTYQIAIRGWSPQSYFSQTIFTYSHDRSIVAVADGLVNGAAVDSVVYQHLAIHEPALVARVRVIERWGPYGASPVVVDPRLASEQKALLQRVFLDMSRNADGAPILQRLGVDRYVVPEERAYDSVRQMRAYLREHGLSP